MQTQKSEQEVSVQESSSELEDYEDDIKYRPKLNSSSKTSWSGLKERYKNLWRTRMRDSDFIKGMRDISIFGFASIAFAFLIGTPTLYGVGTLFFMGSLAGTIWSSYRHDFDDFGNAHVGLFSGLIMHLPIIIGTLTYEPVLLPLVALWSSMYILMMSGVNITYGKVAREANEPSR